MSGFVLTVRNRGESHYVAQDWAELLERLPAPGAELEIGADQCDACGSFDPATGEPGRPFVVRRIAASPSLPAQAHFRAECGACRAPVRVLWATVDETVFPGLGLGLGLEELGAR